jgi:hypothetical protein
LANQQKTSRVVVFACVSGTVGGVIGQVDEPKKCKNPQDEIDGWNEWERVRAKGPWIDDCVFSLMSLKLVLYIVKSKIQEKVENEPERNSVKTFFRFFFLTVRQSCWAAVGLVSGTFWVGGKRTWTCVCFINKSSNYTSCYSTLQHTSGTKQQQQPLGVHSFLNVVAFRPSSF